MTHAGVVLADTDDVVRVLETSHPPTVYLPRTAFREGSLRPAQRRTVCEWKGTARYVDVVPGAAGAEPVVLFDVGWWYPASGPGSTGLEGTRYPILADRVALYPEPFDEILFGDDRVEPQPGRFYGGWITPDVVGPFKGGPGSAGW